LIQAHTFVITAWKYSKTISCLVFLKSDKLNVHFTLFWCGYLHGQTNLEQNWKLKVCWCWLNTHTKNWWELVFFVDVGLSGFKFSNLFFKWLDTREHVIEPWMHSSHAVHIVQRRFCFEIIVYHMGRAIVANIPLNLYFLNKKKWRMVDFSKTKMHFIPSKKNFIVISKDL
jgi:hypothetical protein